MAAVRAGELKINRVADVFEVPRTTLKDRLSGRVNHGTNPGPVPYLTKEEGTELFDFLVQASSIGYGKTKEAIVKHVVNYYVLCTHRNRKRYIILYHVINITWYKISALLMQDYYLLWS